MGQARTLNDYEFHSLLAHIGTLRHSARNILMLKLLHGAGFRVGELAHLRVKDIVTINGDIVDCIILNANQTKGKRGRSVWLNDLLRADLANYLLVANPKPIDYLFTTQKRDFFTPNTLQAVVTRFYRHAGLIGCSSHTGRRSFITKLASVGVSARVLQELAGHRYLSTTQRYIDITDTMKRNAVALAMN